MSNNNFIPLIPIIIFGFLGYLIGVVTFPHVIDQNTYIHNSGICVSAPANGPVLIKTATIDHNGNVYCKAGSFVHTLPNGS